MNQMIPFHLKDMHIDEHMKFSTTKYIWSLAQQNIYEV